MGNTSSVANGFINLSSETGSDLTNMKLVKLMYVAQGLSLSLLDRPLFNDDNIEAWKYGPVIPSIYHEFKHFKSNPITSNSVSLEGEGWDELLEPKLIDEDDRKIVLLTWRLYKDISAKELVQLTHKEGTPWSLTYRYGENRIISNNLIKKYYDRFVDNLERQLKQSA